MPPATRANASNHTKKGGGSSDEVMHFMGDNGRTKVVVAPTGLIRPKESSFDDQIKEYNERRAQLTRHRQLIAKLKEERAAGAPSPTRHDGRDGEQQHNTPHTPPEEIESDAAGSGSAAAVSAAGEAAEGVAAGASSRQSTPRNAAAAGSGTAASPPSPSANPSLPHSAAERATAVMAARQAVADMEKGYADDAVKAAQADADAEREQQRMAAAEEQKRREEEAAVVAAAAAEEEREEAERKRISALNATTATTPGRATSEAADSDTSSPTRGIVTEAGAFVDGSGLLGHPDDDDDSTHSFKQMSSEDEGNAQTDDENAINRPLRGGGGRRYLFDGPPTFTSPSADYSRERAKAYLHALFMAHLVGRGYLKSPFPRPSDPLSDAEEA